MDYRVQWVLEKLVREPGNRLSLNELARRVGLSPSHFGRLFKAAVGVSYQTYVHELRMKMARDLLTRLDLRIKEVAACLGFSHLSSFTRAFETQFGQSPSQYRQTLSGALEEGEIADHDKK